MGCFLGGAVSGGVPRGSHRLFHGSGCLSDDVHAGLGSSSPVVGRDPDGPGLRGEPPGGRGGFCRLGVLFACDAVAGVGTVPPGGIPGAGGVPRHRGLFGLAHLVGLSAFDFLVGYWPGNDLVRHSGLFWWHNSGNWLDYGHLDGGRSAWPGVAVDDGAEASAHRPGGLRGPVDFVHH